MREKFFKIQKRLKKIFKTPKKDPRKIIGRYGLGKNFQITRIFFKTRARLVPEH
jgi:hypothetical protein